MKTKKKYYRRLIAQFYTKTAKRVLMHNEFNSMYHDIFAKNYLKYILSKKSKFYGGLYVFEDMHLVHSSIFMLIS